MSRCADNPATGVGVMTGTDGTDARTVELLGTIARLKATILAQHDRIRDLEQLAHRLTEQLEETT